MVRAQLEGCGAAPATAGRVLASLRGVLRECYRAGLIDRETLDQCCDVRPVSGTRVPPGRHIERPEVAALLEDAAADERPAGLRDQVILALLWGTGMRRAELAAVHVEDTTPDSVRVRGKGGRERVCWLPPSCAQVLARWLRARGTSPGPLICAIGRRGFEPPRAVGPQAIYLALSERARRAGVRPLRPHDLRRTFIGELLDSGVDLATVQAVVGHASPATTSRYDRRGERAARDAAARLTLPGCVQELNENSP